MYLGSVTEREFAFNVIEIYVHPQVFSNDPQLSTDMTVTDNA
ncbi:Uncharacterised protein [Vibrio cholerae]|nr:Uncharacterised protein [Vibrio cholerae]